MAVANTLKIAELYEQGRTWIRRLALFKHDSEHRCSAPLGVLQARVVRLRKDHGLALNATPTVDARRDGAGKALSL